MDIQLDLNEKHSFCKNSTYNLSFFLVETEPTNRIHGYYYQQEMYQPIEFTDILSAGDESANRNHHWNWCRCWINSLCNGYGNFSLGENQFFSIINYCIFCEFFVWIVLLFFYLSYKINKIYIKNICLNAAFGSLCAITFIFAITIYIIINYKC